MKKFNHAFKRLQLIDPNEIAHIQLFFTYKSVNFMCFKPNICVTPIIKYIPIKNT